MKQKISAEPLLLDKKMNVSTEEKKAEAIARMKTLGISPKTIKFFEKKGVVSFSAPPFGARYWVEDEVLDRIRQFEQSTNALVYMVVRTYTSLGTMDSFLFVDDYPEDWEIDQADLPNRAVAYVYNHDAPDSPEMGSIGLTTTPTGGLLRTW